MSVFLKVKLKSLAEEARIIKHEENKRKVPRARAKAAKPEGGEADQAVVKQHQREIRHIVRDIRAERRAKDWYPKTLVELQSLHRHRVDVVKKEARLTSIAYGYIRGRKFSQVDSGRNLKPEDWEIIGRMIRRYGSLESSLDQWAKAA